MKVKYTARMLFNDFREAYPELWRYGTQYELCDVMTILIQIPTVGKLTYCYHGDKITWLEHWEDPKAKKAELANKRFDDYSYFLFMLKDIMEYRRLSQSDVADMTGYSRQSINAYLSGRTFPKYDTMKDIMNKLGFEDF